MQKFIHTIFIYEHSVRATAVGRDVERNAVLVIVRGFETRVGLRVGYAGYGSGLDSVNPQCTRTLGTGSGLPVP